MNLISTVLSQCLLLSVELLSGLLQGINLKIKRINLLYGGEKSSSHSINIESKYNVLQNSSITGKFTFNNIDFISKTGAATTTVSYIMLDGLLPGKNYLWSLTLTKRLLNNLELNFQYDGRKPATSKTVHIGKSVDYGVVLSRLIPRRGLR